MINQLHHDITHIASLKGKAKQAFMESIASTPRGLNLKNYLSVVYSNVNWYQTKMPKGPVSTLMLGKLASSSFDIMDALEYYFDGPDSNRRGSKGAQRLAVTYTLLKTQENRDLLQWALWGDIKAGVGAKTINKVFPSLIFIPPYMRCETLDKGHHLKWNWMKGVHVQNKEDQMFGNLVCTQTGSELYSRSWNLISTGGTALDPLKKFAGVVRAGLMEDMVVHGEIQVKDENGVFLTREGSNGVINGLIQTGTDIPDGYSIEFAVWDMVALSEFNKGKFDIPYSLRFASLVEQVELSEVSQVRVVETDIVTKFEDIVPIFIRTLKNKREGLVIKNPDGVWLDSDGSTDQIKLKVQMDDVELRIVGFNEADPKSKHRDTFASLQCESEDGRVVTGVSGLSDDKRQEIHENREFFLGSIISVKCNGIQYNNEEPHSLYYPAFIEERRDKVVADTFERIVSIQEASIITSLMAQSVK